MNKYQCLWYALDQWYERGGYLCLCRSVHWGMPHVIHSMTLPPEAAHYVPPCDLKQPWYSLFGFHGVAIVGDPYKRGPMGYVGMFFGTFFLFVLGGIWVLARMWRRIRG